MKKLPTKKDLRNELDQQIADFLDQGGAVDKVEKGISRYNNAIPPAFNQSFSGPAQKRTFINDVVNNLDQRKQANKKSSGEKPKKPKRVLLYDDFGEPLRWVWQD